MADPTANEPPEPVSNEDVGDEQEEERVPGDWQDVKRYLFGLISLVMVAVVLMLGVAIYEYWHYAGAKAEDTTPIPASEDVMRQGALPPRLHGVHEAPSAPSARTPPPARSAP